MSAVLRWMVALAALLVVACSPAVDDAGTNNSGDPNPEVIGADGGQFDTPRTEPYGAFCELTVDPGALNSEARFRGKTYNNPADMARDTAPILPFLQDVLSPGCYMEPVNVPLKADRYVKLRHTSEDFIRPFAPQATFDRLFSDGRDDQSFLWVLYRADPFGEWRAENIVGDARFVWDFLGRLNIKVERGDKDIRRNSARMTKLGYSFLVAGLYLSPNLPGNVQVDEGAPIPFAVGLGGSLAASGMPVLRLSFRDELGLQLPPLASDPVQEPGPPLRLTGQIPFWELWRGRSEVTLTMWVEYSGTLQVDSSAGPPTFLSRPMKVTFVASAPRIDTQPASITVVEGQTATFSVIAGGSRPLAYQWRRNGLDIAGATAASYVTPATTLADSGAQYSVVVTNARGTLTSLPATLTVQPAPAGPAIVRGPLPVMVTVGQPATFDVLATGAAPLAYQWLRNGAAIAGATAVSYSLATTALSDDGALFSVRVSNAVLPAGVTSAAARLTVSPPSTLPRGAADIVSLKSDNTLGGLDSGSGGLVHALSHDGRYVAFVSRALLTGGGCGVFLRDMQMRQTRLITVRPDGTPGSLQTGGNCNDSRVAMTPDARHVAFISEHADLVARTFPAGLLRRAYVRDTCIGAPTGCVPRTTLVAVDDADVTLAGNSSSPSISDNGRYVAFEGRAPNTTASVTAAVVHDRDADGNGLFDERPTVPDPANPTFRSFAVSRQNSGALFTGGSRPMISGNGRFVVFEGGLNNPGDCTRPSGVSSRCVYVYDRDANNNGVLDETTVAGGVRTINVSISTGGAVALGGEVGFPWISADGRVVTFRTEATNLGATTPALFPLYTHDRDVAASGFFDTAGNVRTAVASLDAAGSEVSVLGYSGLRGLSRRGRFVLLDGPGNWAPPNDPNAATHLYLRDTCAGAAAPTGCTPSTVRLSVRSDGTVPDGNVSTYYGALSGDGRRVAFSQAGGDLIDLSGDNVREGHSSIEVYYGSTGTGEP